MPGTQEMEAGPRPAAARSLSPGEIEFGFCIHAWSEVAIDFATVPDRQQMDDIVCCIEAINHPVIAHAQAASIAAR